jgi:hypothetical protein
MPFAWTRRHSLVGVVSLCVVTLTGFVVWMTLSERAADDVSAHWSLECSGTTVGTRLGEPRIRSRPGWRCDLSLKITNAGKRSVHVHEIEGAFMGTEGGAEVQGFSTSEARIHDADTAQAAAGFGDRDAVWDVDTLIPAESSRTVHLRIGWRRSGCNSAGSIGFPEWPVIVFEALGRTHRFSPDQSLELRTFDDPHDAVVCRSD